MYKIKIDSLEYYYDDLCSACYKMCDYLKIFNLSKYAKSGEFISTKFWTGALKVKKYELKLTTSPPIYIEIFKKDKEPLQPELIFYYIDKWKEKNENN